jgi:hypothetical protein
MLSSRSSSRSDGSVFTPSRLGDAPLAGWFVLALAACDSQGDWEVSSAYASGIDRAYAKPYCDELSSRSTTLTDGRDANAWVRVMEDLELPTGARSACVDWAGNVWLQHLRQGTGATAAVLERRDATLALVDAFPNDATRIWCGQDRVVGLLTAGADFQINRAYPDGRVQQREFDGSLTPVAVLPGQERDVLIATAVFPFEIDGLTLLLGWVALGLDSDLRVTFVSALPLAKFHGGSFIGAEWVVAGDPGVVRVSEAGVVSLGPSVGPEFQIGMARVAANGDVAFVGREAADPEARLVFGRIDLDGRWLHRLTLEGRSAVASALEVDADGSAVALIDLDAPQRLGGVVLWPDEATSEATRYGVAISASGQVVAAPLGHAPTRPAGAPAAGLVGTTGTTSPTAVPAPTVATAPTAAPAPVVLPATAGADDALNPLLLVSGSAIAVVKSKPEVPYPSEFPVFGVRSPPLQTVAWNRTPAPLANVSDGPVGERVELNGDSHFTSVARTADGGALLIREAGETVTFTEYPSGTRSPPFTVPAGTRADTTFEWAGGELLVLDDGVHSGAISLRAYRATEAGWELAQDVAPVAMPSELSDPAATISVRGDVLALGAFSRVRLFRREAGAWTPLLDVAPGTVQRFSLAERHLAVATAEQLRAYSVEAFVESGSLSDRGVWTSSPEDVPLLDGDWMFMTRQGLPASTRHFEDRWRTGGNTAVQGIPARFGTKDLLVTDSRGAGSAVWLHSHRGAWRPLERFTPPQFDSGFGATSVVLEDALLVAAPGHGTGAEDRGAVFRFRLEGCAGTECWGPWVCGF